MCADMAQLVERTLGKGEVTGSNPVRSTKLLGVRQVRLRHLILIQAFGGSNPSPSAILDISQLDAVSFLAAANKFYCS